MVVIVTFFVFFSGLCFIAFVAAFHVLKILEKASYHAMLHCVSFSVRREKRIFLHCMKRMSRDYRMLCSAVIVNPCTREVLSSPFADPEIPGKMAESLVSISAAMNDYSISRLRARLLLGKKLYSSIA